MKLNDERTKLYIVQQANAAWQAYQEVMGERCVASSFYWYEKEMSALCALCTVFGLNHQKICHFIEKHGYEMMAAMNVDEFAERFSWLPWD